LEIEGTTDANTAYEGITVGIKGVDVALVDGGVGDIGSEVREEIGGPWGKEVKREGFDDRIKFEIVPRDSSSVLALVVIVKFVVVLVDEITTEKFNEQSSWSFLGIFGGKSDWDYYNSAVSDVVKANTVVNIQVKGGTWNPQAFSYMQKTGLLGNYQFDLKDVTDGPILDWDTFALSVKDNMVPIHYELIPMYTIFSDPVISNNFKTVTQQWINSRLKERADVRPRWV